MNITISQEGMNPITIRTASEKKTIKRSVEDYVYEPIFTNKQIIDNYVQQYYTACRAKCHSNFKSVNDMAKDIKFQLELNKTLQKYKKYEKPSIDQAKNDPNSNALTADYKGITGFIMNHSFANNAVSLIYTNDITFKTINGATIAFQKMYFKDYNDTMIEPTLLIYNKKGFVQRCKIDFYGRLIK